VKDTSPIRYAQETPYAAVTDISSDILAVESTYRPKEERLVGRLLQYHSLISVQFTLRTYCRRYTSTQPWQHPLYASSKQLPISSHTQLPRAIHTISHVGLGSIRYNISFAQYTSSLCIPFSWTSSSKTSSPFSKTELV